MTGTGRSSLSLPWLLSDILRHLAALLVLCSLGVLLSCSGSGGSGSNNESGQSSAAVLQATVTSPGKFSAGEQGATYSIEVTNTGSAATSGTVTLVDPPTGFQVTAMSGTNWTCVVSTTTCTYSLSVAAGQAFPPIAVTGNVTASNGSAVSISLTASGGGAASTTTSPAPTVSVAAVALSITKTHSGSFAQGQAGATYTVTVSNAGGGGTTSGAVSVTEVPPSGLTVTGMTGSNWTCTVATLVCTRSDALAGGSSYPAISVTVNVSSSATSPQVNQVSVSGGNQVGTVPPATDSTTISTPTGIDLTITKSHTGNFSAGTNNLFNLAVSNVGNAPTTGTITVSDTLASQFTFVSGSGNGWTCAAAGQVVTCTNPGPIAAGSSAASIPLIVSLSGSASGNIANTATVSTAGDTNTANNSSTDNVTVVSPSSISSVTLSQVAQGPVFAGIPETISIAVSNDQASDNLNASLTASGVACAPECGTLGSISGTPGSGSYTLLYTPPASVTAATSATLEVTSSLPNAFPGTISFTVNPAGARVITVSGVGQRIMVGSAAKANLTAVVYNDTGATTGATLELLASGYACPSSGTGSTICGALAITGASGGTTTTGIPFTTTTFSYTPPASVPNPPYDRPMFFAVSNADRTVAGQNNFILSTTSLGNLSILDNTRLNTAFADGAATTIQANLTGDTGVNKQVRWTLTSGGVDCQPSCGTLGNPAYAYNGVIVTATIPYTPPSVVPTGSASSPTITATSVDVIGSSQQVDSFGFQIVSAPCGTGNDAVLNGQYAFLLQGAGIGAGYVASIGSLTADGNGNITTGLLDNNGTLGPHTGMSIVSAGSSYSIGPDNRGCLTLANSAGGVATYRIAVGTLNGSNVATQGRMIRFDDTTGESQQLQGVLMMQNSTSFATSALSGNYVFGYQGSDVTGGRVAVAGLYAADGAGHLSGFDLDADDAGTLDTNDTSGSGTYTVDTTTGRGTIAITNTSDSNYIFYVVNSSQLLAMSSDAIGAGLPILAGQHIKQTVTSYTQTSFDSKGYAYYEYGIDPSNGGNGTVVGQLQFTTNGNNTGTQNINDNGTVSEQTNPGTVTIGSNGRAVSSGDGGILYMSSTGSGFLVGVDSFVAFGYVQQQTGGPFTNASSSGNYYIGSLEATTGGLYQSGTVTANGAGGLTGNADNQYADFGINSSALDYSYAVSASPAGLVTLTSPGNAGLVGYMVSPSTIFLMSTSTNPTGQELTIAQK